MQTSKVDPPHLRDAVVLILVTLMGVAAVEFVAGPQALALVPAILYAVARLVSALR